MSTENKLNAVAAASTIAASPEMKDEPGLACFTFILESRGGYTAEGCYPNVTTEQYKLIVAILEGKMDPPKIVVARTMP